MTILSILIYLLETRDEVFENFKMFKIKVENQLRKKIKRTRSNNGGKYLSNKLISFCETHRIVREVTTPHTPPQHGAAERKNRTTLGMINTMLIQSNLPMIF